MTLSFYKEYSFFPTICPGKRPYLSEWAAEVHEVPMSSWDEEILSMMGALAVFGAFCITALLIV